MSTGADCKFIEVEPNKWFYFLQKYPYGETEDYTKEGPFRTLQKAEQHLQKNYANPGGCWIESYSGSKG